MLPAFSLFPHIYEKEGAGLDGQNNIIGRQEGKIKEYVNAHL